MYTITQIRLSSLTPIRCSLLLPASMVVWIKLLLTTRSILELWLHLLWIPLVVLRTMLLS